jgi:hypothetical protein
MRRSAGVTVIAVIVLIGSVLTVGLGLLTSALALVIPMAGAGPSGESPPPALVLVFAGLIYLVPGVFGLISGIGLVRLRNWARISTIVFAVFLIVTAAFMLLAAMMLPAVSSPNAQIDAAQMASIMAMMRIAMAVTSLALIALGVWWAIFLTRRAATVQFAGGAAPLDRTFRRPVSITVIAWFMLVGCAGVFLSIALRSPVPFFVIMLTGVPALLYVVATGATLVYAGIGLLRLAPTARLVSIGYFAFGILNSAVFALGPGGHARLVAFTERARAMNPMTSPAPPPFQVDMLPMMYASMAAAVLGGLVPIYFLVARKGAFLPAGAAAPVNG